MITLGSQARGARCAVLFGLLLLAGCAGGPAPEPDVSGAHRVVVLAPAAAEMLEALDLLGSVVGIGEFGPWPDAVAELPVVGGYNSPNVERVLEIGANLVITAASQAAVAAHQRLESLGVSVLALDTGTYDGIFASLAEIGEAFDRRDESSALAARMRSQVQEVETRVADLPRVRVLFVVGRDPMYVAGPGSHIDRMIALAGGENVAHDALAPYQQVSVEAILERQPQVIIDTSDNRRGARRGREVGSWGRWEFLPAVTNDRVYWIDPSQLVIPGMRLPEMTRLMGKLIHPDVFGEPAGAEFLRVTGNGDEAAS